MEDPESPVITPSLSSSASPSSGGDEISKKRKRRRSRPSKSPKDEPDRKRRRTAETEKSEELPSPEVNQDIEMDDMSTRTTPAHTPPSPSTTPPAPSADPSQDSLVEMDEPSKDIPSSPAEEATENNFRRRLRPRKARQDPIPTKSRKRKRSTTNATDQGKPKKRIKKAYKKKKLPSFPKKPKEDCLKFDIRSRAYDDNCRPYHSWAKIGNPVAKDNPLSDVRRGHRFLVYDFDTQEVEYTVTFDTWEEHNASERMNVFLHTLPFGKILVCIVNDCGFWRNNGTHEALRKFGAEKMEIGNRQSYLLVTWTIPGCKPIFEETRERFAGPVDFRNYVTLADLQKQLGEHSQIPQTKPRTYEPYDLKDVVPEHARPWVEAGTPIECATCGKATYPETIVYCHEPCHIDDKSYDEIKRLAEERRERELKNHKKELEEEKLKPHLPERGRAFHFWCAPQVSSIWHQYLLELADKNNMDISEWPAIRAGRDTLEPISHEHAKNLGQLNKLSSASVPPDTSASDANIMENDGKETEEMELKEKEEAAVVFAGTEATQSPAKADSSGDAEHPVESSAIDPDIEMKDPAPVETLETCQPEPSGVDLVAEVATPPTDVDVAVPEAKEIPAPTAAEESSSIPSPTEGPPQPADPVANGHVEVQLEQEDSKEESEQRATEDIENPDVISDEVVPQPEKPFRRPELPAEAPDFDKLNITLVDLSRFPKLYPPTFLYTCKFHMLPSEMACAGCEQPLVPQKYSDVEAASNRESDRHVIFCNVCTMKIPKRRGVEPWVFRCPEGIHCDKFDDGFDVCVDCVLQKQRDSTSTSGFATCMCGRNLPMHESADVFDYRESCKVLSKRSQFKCSDCRNLIPLVDKCFACIDDHCLWKYQLCIPCYASRERSQLRCSDCRHGLHCVYLEDVYKTQKVEKNFPLESRQKLREKRRKMKLSNKKLNEDDLGCVWTDVESDVEDDAQREEEVNAETVHTSSVTKRIPMTNCAKCGKQLFSNQFAFVCSYTSHGEQTICHACALEGDPRDEAMIVKPLTPKCYKEVELVLIFVAHAGITQPGLWQKWLDELSAEDRPKIGIAIQANNTEECQYGKEFVHKYRIDVQRSTRWGKLLVVTTIQQSMRLALLRFPAAQRFYFISGSEIPVVSARRLLDMPHQDKSQMMFQDVSNRRAWRKRKLRNAIWYCHHAALVFVRKHLRLLSVSPIARYFKDADSIFSGVGAPDEFCWGTMLASFGVDMQNEVWRDVTTDFELPPKQSRHPIDFIALDEEMRKAHVDRNMRRIGIGKISLRQRLEDGSWSEHSIWGKGPCFFRKVAHTVEFGDFLPWSPGPVREGWVDEYAGMDPALHDGGAGQDGYDSQGLISDAVPESESEIEQPPAEEDPEYNPPNE